MTETAPIATDLAPVPATVSTEPRPQRPWLDLFLVSFLILFLELAAIRWFGSTVVFLTFFTNIVLMATFLGMSVGCMLGAHPRNYARWILPLLTFTMALAMIVANAYTRLGRITIDVGGQTASPQLIFFGTEYRPPDPTQFVIPIWVVAGLFFTLISLVFVGLGQVMGRAFDAIDSRVGAYTVNILGSLVGILAFSGASYLMLSPHVWFFIALLLCLRFARPLTASQVVSALIALFLIGASAHGAGQKGQTLWSPYYRITYEPRNGSIDTNGIAHQQMVRVLDAGPAYFLPHLLNKNSGGKPFEDVLIIGAGSGNDVAAARAMGAKNIDAVEIDPMIRQLGIWDHPDKPYAAPEVHSHLNDGRRFVKSTTNKYDLASYALVDSLVLHSGYSSLRLESFLFTEQALQDVKSRLKPGGVFAMYNYYRQGWVVGRLYEMAKKTFGVEPIVISLPHQKTISAADNQADHITFLLVGLPDESGKVPVLENIRKKFAESPEFWVHEQPSFNMTINGFGKQPAPAGRGRWSLIAPASINTADIGQTPTDNWPFLYLRKAEIPWRPVGQGMALIGALSFVILLAFTLPVWFGKGQTRARFNPQMFFLGAGFMLLETRGVVTMALLFGSTWIVNSIVFFAILVMILFANLFVLAFKPRNLWPWYALLAVALLLNAFLPASVYLALAPLPRTIASCAVFFIPVFFAGVIFSASFRDSKRPDVDFGSNIAGVILGGLSEQLSLIVGFSYLLLIALAYYALSALLKPRAQAVPST